MSHLLYSQLFRCLLKRFWGHLMQQKKTRLFQILIKSNQRNIQSLNNINYIRSTTTLNLHLGKQKMSLHWVNSERAKLKCCRLTRVKIETHLHTQIWAHRVPVKWQERPLVAILCIEIRGRDGVQHQPESSGSEKTHIKLNVKLTWDCQPHCQLRVLSADVCDIMKNANGD